MKLRNVLIFAVSSSLITSVTFAMIGGTEKPVITQAFEEALRTGTKEAVTQCMQDHSIKFNTRCIPWQLTPRGTDFNWAYPLEYAIKYYGTASEGSFRSRIQLLLDLGAPLDEYEDYSPLIHSAGASSWETHLPILLNLGAGPHKRITYYGRSVTPLKWVEDCITKNSTKTQYAKILNLFLHPPAVEKSIPQTPGPTPNAPVRPLSPTFPNLIKEASARPADTTPDITKHNKNTVYTRQQVAVIVGIAFLTGILCTKFFEWYVKRTEDISGHPQAEQETNQDDF